MPDTTKRPPRRSIDQIADEFARQRRVWNLYHWLSPVPDNARTQKARFEDERRAGRPYEPQYLYPEYDPAEYLRDWKTLEEIRGQVMGGPLQPLLEEECRFLTSQLMLIKLRGDAERFSLLSRSAFGMPSEAEVKSARLDLSRVPAPLPDRPITPEQLSARARKHLAHLRITGWEVQIIPHLTTIMKIDSGHRRIELRGDFTFGPVDEISLLRHEIEGHIVRAENGFRLGHEFLGLGVGFETELDEGIACLLEDRHGGLCGRRFQELATRVAAVEAAQRAGFCAVYDAVVEIAPEIGPDLTYQLTLRVKRGLKDTSQPGGWTKDALYYTG
ncbi:DUF1704 domain-containing protein, partial [Candidatus Poribacteria bacterium]|nr:DUF1704 domain-containing protein [Candidatus Poribacteria bacterium]